MFSSFRRLQGTRSCFLALLSTLALTVALPAPAQSPPADQPAAPAPSESPPPASPSPPAALDTSPSPPTPNPAVQPPAAPPPVKSPEELASIRKRLADANAQTARILNQLSSLDAQIFQINQAIADGERQSADLISRIEASGNEMARLQLRAEDLRKIWSHRARRMYKDTPGTAWAPLFSAQTWSDFGRLKKVWRSLAEGHTRLVAESGQLKDQMAAEKAALLAASQSLENRKQELNSSRERLRQTREGRTASLGRLRYAIGQAMVAEQAALVADAVGVPVLHPCSHGSTVQDRKLADLLEWYAPAAGPEPFIPPKLAPTGIVLTAQASWYGPRFEGCRASSGSTFRSNQMTAASLSLPFGTLLKVTNAGKAAVVVITDRGPYIPGRELDLSHAAAQAIGLAGVGPVAMEIVLPMQPAPPYP